MRQQLRYCGAFRRGRLRLQGRESVKSFLNYSDSDPILLCVKGIFFHGLTVIELKRVSIKLIIFKGGSMLSKGRIKVS